MKDLNKLAKEVYEANKSKGFHDTEQSDETLLMLVITELSEAVEAHRKVKMANVHLFNAFDTDNEYEQKKHQNRWDRPSHDVFSFQSCIKDTVEDELADSVIRLLDLAGLRNISIYEYNTERKSHYEIAKKHFPTKSFPELIFAVIPTLLSEDIAKAVSLSILSIEWICEHLNIDLWQHVDLKFQYNKTREYKHGKAY